MFERCAPAGVAVQALADYELARAAGAKPGETSVGPRVR